MFGNMKFWIVIIGLPILATLPDLTIKYMKQIFMPTPTDKVMYKIIYATDEKEEAKEGNSNKGRKPGVAPK